MYTFEVQDMTCGGCAASVTRAVQRLDAAAKVEVDLAAKSVTVVSGRTLDEVRGAIADAGFPVTGAR